MRRIALLSLTGLALAGLTAGAQEAPKLPPTAPVTDAEASNRIVVTAMIPPPDVGKGAPYHSTEDIATIAQEAGQTAVAAISDGRIAGQADSCRDTVIDMMSSTRRNPLEHIAAYTVTLQGLYRDEKSQAQRVTALAKKALDATTKAEDARRDAAQGANNKAAVDKTELDRQKVVTELEKARLKLMETQASIADYGQMRMNSSSRQIDWSDLDAKALRRRKAGWGLGVPNPAAPELALLNLTSAERQDDGGFFLRVQGVVLNTSKKPVKVPDVVVSILDIKGFALRNAVAAVPPNLVLQPGAGQAFSYDIRPSPQYVGRIAVNFASGREPPPELPVRVLCPENPPTD